jgi:hypothetical protein
MYPETTVLKSTRPSGSGDLAQNSIGHSDSGFALGPVKQVPFAFARGECGCALLAMQ